MAGVHPRNRVKFDADMRRAVPVPWTTARMGAVLIPSLRVAPSIPSLPTRPISKG